MVAWVRPTVYPYNYADLWKTEHAGGKGVLVATSNCFRAIEYRRGRE